MATTLNVVMEVFKSVSEFASQIEELNKESANFIIEEIEERFDIPQDKILFLIESTNDLPEKCSSVHPLFLFVWLSVK